MASVNEIKQAPSIATHYISVLFFGIIFRMPMNKNFTPESTFTHVIAETKQRPKKITLAKIRQFARAYTFAPVEIPALGNMWLIN